MPSLATFVQHYTQSPTHSNQPRKIKDIQIGKEVVNLSLSADGFMLYVENSKAFIKNLLEVIDEFNQGAGYKINIQKSVVFLYTKNECKKKKL